MLPVEHLMKLLAHARCQWRNGHYQCKKQSTHFFPLEDGFNDELRHYCNEHARQGIGGLVPYSLKKAELDRFRIEGIEQFQNHVPCPNCDGLYRYRTRETCKECGHSKWEDKELCETCFGYGQVRRKGE